MQQQLVPGLLQERQDEQQLELELQMLELQLLEQERQDEQQLELELLAWPRWHRHNRQRQ